MVRSVPSRAAARPARHSQHAGLALLAIAAMLAAGGNDAWAGRDEPRYPQAAGSPTVQPEVPAPNGAQAPRLAGIAVWPGERRAIFVAADGDLAVLVEGERLGNLTVQQISEHSVTLTGADGTRVLRPTPAGAPAGWELPLPAGADPGKETRGLVLRQQDHPDD